MTWPVAENWTAKLLSTKFRFPLFCPATKEGRVGPEKMHPLEHVNNTSGLPTLLLEYVDRGERKRVKTETPA